jgi:ASC-1-like (ASCH) protein
MDYKNKYIKYKKKYLELKNINIHNQIGGKKLKNNRHNRHNKNNNKHIMEIKYNEHLSEPWFSLISLGLKTLEGRKNKGKFKDMQVGDIIQWYNNDFKERKILTKIIGKADYRTFEEYLTTEGLDKCLPGIPSLEHGLSVYFKYFTKQDEIDFGVVAIKLKLL